MERPSALNNMKRDSSEKRIVLHYARLRFLDTTEVVQRDEVPWERCVALVALFEDQPDVDDWYQFERKFILVQGFG